MYSCVNLWFFYVHIFHFTCFRFWSCAAVDPIICFTAATKCLICFVWLNLHLYFWIETQKLKPWTVISTNNYDFYGCSTQRLNTIATAGCKTVWVTNRCVCVCRWGCWRVGVTMFILVSLSPLNWFYFTFEANP